MPLLWLSLAFLAGIVLADLAILPVWAWITLAGGTLALWIVWRVVSRLLRLRRAFLRLEGTRLFTLAKQAQAKMPVAVCLLLAVLWIGAARFQAALPEITAENIAWYNDRDVLYLVEGVIVDFPDVRDTYTNLRVKVDRIRPAQGEQSYPVKGLVLARVLPGGDWRYGDRIMLNGKLETPPVEEGFSYRDYLARQSIYSLIQPTQVSRLLKDQGNPFRAAVYSLKERLLDTVYQIFPDPEASLMAGILLGVESGIPLDVQEAFNATGTSHIIAISGFNISILAGLFTMLFSRLLGRWRGALLAALGVAFYTVLVGAEASVVRAAVMGWFSLLAVQIGRRQNGLNSLAVVAAVMAAFNPNILWEVGFQLSFMATLGLVLYADPIQGAFNRLAARHLPTPLAERLGKLVGEYLLLTLAAQILVIPVIAYHFRQLSLTMFIANPLILPVQPAVMILGGLAVLGGVIFQPLGQTLAYLAWSFVAYTIRMVELLAQLKGGVVSLGSIRLVWVIIFYGLVFLLTWAGAHRDSPFTRRLRSLSPAVPLVGLGIATILVWREAFASPDGRLHLIVLDVSQGSHSGEGLLIRTPQGRTLLINGGPSASRLSDALGRQLPLFSRRLDFLVVAGVQNGQLQALPEVLARYPPQQVLWAGPLQASRSSRNLHEKLATERIPLKLAQTGQALNLGSGASLHLLEVGQRGAVLLLEWQDFRALLPIGMSFDEMAALENGKQVGRVTALLLADSGYAPLNPPAWIAALQPQVILLSVSLKDTTGLPSPAALEAVEGYTLLRTDYNGWIELCTDGERMWVEAERK